MRFDELDLGTRLLPYEPTWQLQREVHAAVADGTREDTVLLCEHEDVYTAGRRTATWDRPVDGTPVVDVDRGGRITWHGPGQLVGYPIVKLATPIDVVRYVRVLEEALIRTCADLGLDAIRVEGRSGVWFAADDDPPGAQGRRDRRARLPRRHDARLRAQLRARPGRVRPHRAVRDRGRRRHVAVRRDRPARDHRRGRCPWSAATWSTPWSRSSPRAPPSRCDARLPRSRRRDGGLV